MLRESLSLNWVTLLINQCKQQGTKHHGLFAPAPASCKRFVQGGSIIESRLPTEYYFRFISSQNDDRVRSPGNGLKNKLGYFTQPWKYDRYPHELNNLAYVKKFGKKEMY